MVEKFNDGNFMAGLVGTFPASDRSAPHSQGREPARQIHCGFADGAEPRSRSYAPEEQGRTDRCVIRTMRGEGAGRPGLNCCASYWPISLLKAEAFGRSKSRSPVAALPLCRRLTCAARARALCGPRKWVRRKVESFMTPCSPVHAGGFFFTYYFLCNFRNVQ